jgi:RimJ/RimL family protein N-acetyltransferase
MQRLFEACLSRGYDVIEGVVLGENTSMLRFCERLGFTIRMNPDDLAERIARRQLR